MAHQTQRRLKTQKETRLLKLLRLEEARCLEVLDALRVVIEMEETDLRRHAFFRDKSDEYTEVHHNYKRREDMKKRRKSLKMTQTELAQKIGISLGTIMRYEQGLAVRKNTEDKIVKLLDSMASN